MPRKKTVSITAYKKDQSASVYSYFMDKIFPILIGVAISISGTAIVVYFRVATLAAKVEALETTKDTYVPRYIVSEEQIKHQKEQLDRLEKGQETILEYFRLPLPEKE